MSTEKLTKAFSLNSARVKHRVTHDWMSHWLNPIRSIKPISATLRSVGNCRRFSRASFRKVGHTHTHIRSFRMAKHDREQRCSRTSVYVYMRNYVNQLRPPRYPLICRVNPALVYDTSHNSQKIALTKIAVKGLAIIRYVYVCFEMQLIFILSIFVCEHDRYRRLYIFHWLSTALYPRGNYVN